MADWQGMRRVYDRVEVVKSDGGFVIRLDRHTLKSPGGVEICISAYRLAEAVAEEWDAQLETIDAASMPMTAFACTLVDRVEKSRDELTANLLAFAEADTLCYRVSEPDELVRRQRETWQPWLDWATSELDAPLLTTAGITVIAQPTQSIEVLGRVVERLEDGQLLGVATAAAAMGSFVLAFALFKMRLSADEAVDVALLEERHRLERWGTDAEAEERIESIRQELHNVVRYLSLISDE